VDVRDEEKSSFDSYRKRALIKPPTWQIPNIRNAIPEADNSRFTCIAYASRTGVDAPEMDLLSDMASCTLYATSRGEQEWFTNSSVCMYANLHDILSDEAIFRLPNKTGVRKALSEESNNSTDFTTANVCDAADAKRMQSSIIDLKQMPGSMICLRQMIGSMTDKRRCKLRTERSNSSQVAIQS
jgi:hypothetical protein